MSRDKEKASGNFKLEVPISASQVEGFKPGQEVKVLITSGDGAQAIKSQTVKLDQKGNSSATFAFTARPGDLRVALGPPDASDEELLGLQTITQTAPAQQWQEGRDLKLAPIIISSFYWHWWLRWCRTFVIHGRVLCADGSPVAGAKVCAYDVDWWWWWSSLQQVGCDTTDVTGSFTIKFRWCCGFWPWWWWLRRYWELEPLLAERVLSVLHRDVTIRKLPLPGPRPDLTVFSGLVPEDHAAAPGSFGLLSPASVSGGAAPTTTVPSRQTRFDPTVLVNMREQLLKRVPAAPELEKLRIWPWWPWQPWFDCDPDVIFRVTQNCQGQQKVIVNETVFQARWDIPTTLNVTLTANNEACCLQVPHPDPPNPCVVIEDVCDSAINLIGGNPGAPPAPAGFLRPGLASINGDRPFGGTVVIQGLLGNGVDYYEFEWSDDNGANWHDMPASAVGDVVRQYYEPLFTWQNVPFLNSIDGRLVYESRQHYEATHNPATWNVSRFWTVQDYFSLMRWVTSLTNFADGTYRLRVKGWTLSAGHLVAMNPQYLPVCNTQIQNGVVIAIDNRLTGPGSGHPPSVPNHPCDGGTVHLCTMEPDTDVIDVQILHADHTQTQLGACGKVKINNTDVLRVDFLAYDQSGHLADYSLMATFGENQQRDLLTLAGRMLTPLGGGPVPAALQVGPSYTEARSANPPPNGGAVPPIWAGGAIRLEVAAHLAFPETCCYQLELRARKRTVVSCDYSFWPHSNLSEYSFTVEV
jgi:hypothetical protein